jgi:hypothetical protein
MSTTEKEVEKIPWIWTTIFAAILALIGPLWMAVLPDFPFFSQYNLGTVLCHLTLQAAPWIVMLLVAPFTRIGSLKNKITPANLGCLYIAAMTTSFYIGTHHGWIFPGALFVHDRVSYPDVSMDIIPTWMAPAPDICRQLITGGVPIPWDQWVAPIIFWWFFDVTVALFLLSLTNIFRHQWIDVEQIPFPQAMAVNELMAINSQMAGTTPKVAERLRPFLIGMLIGLVYQGIIMFTAYFPWFPDILGWRINTCGHGGVYVTPDSPLAGIAGLTVWNKHISVIAVGYLVPLAVLFNTWFWYLAYLIVAQIAYSIGYYTGITGQGGCGRVGCNGFVTDPPLALASVANGGMIAFTVIHLFIIRNYLLDTIRAVMGKGKLVETEKNEPISYKMTYLLLLVSFATLMGILFILGSGPTGFFVPITIFVLFVFNSRLWGMTGVWNKGTNYHFGAILGRYTFWQGAAPIPPTKEFVFTNVELCQQDDPDYGWFGTAVSSFASYRIANLTGLSNKGAMKIMLGATLVAPIYMISMIYMMYTLGVSRIPIGAAWTSGCSSFVSCAYSGAWQRKPGPSTAPQLVVGFVVTSLFTFLHARYIWFPFEPIGFILSISYPSIRTGFWFSFLVAWIAKTLTIRVGGSKLYERTGVPLAGGILAGTMVIVLLGSIIGIWKFFFPF